MKPVFTASAGYFGALILIFAYLLCVTSGQARPDSAAGDVEFADAICPIVYPVDETPSDQGYQYIFYGNAFFINKDGYLITAAHVLSAFRYGQGQPYILLSRPLAPPVLHKAKLVAVDWKHDVAVLQATPNPFQGKFKVASLPLTATALAPGNPVIAVALRPFKVQDAHTYQAPVHDRFAGQVVDFQFTQEEKGAPDTELLLFDHDVIRGQSGAPVISGNTHEVVGIVDGRWLRRPGAAQLAANAAAAASAKPVAPSLGAAVRAHYAIALLQQHGISWQEAPSVPEAEAKPVEPAKPEEEDVSVPSPVSVVPAPYPPQALFGGEVVLEGVVDAEGTLTDVNVVQGDPPFVTKAQDAVETWSFRPSRIEGKAVAARIAVVFDFAEPYLPSPKKPTHTYPEPPDAENRAPLPVSTIEPQYPVNTLDEGTVVATGVVDAEGHLVSTRVIRGSGPLAAATTEAMQQWRFVPGKRGGQAVESAIVVVAAFRRPALARLSYSGQPAGQ